jgi:hypothetical protein
VARDGSDYHPEVMELLNLTHAAAEAIGDRLTEDYPEEAEATLEDLSWSEAVLATIVIGGFRYTIELIVTQIEEGRNPLTATTR